MRGIVLVALVFVTCGLIVNAAETGAAPRPNDQAALVARGR